MHWLRVDRYFTGDPEQPQVVTQPVTCHHCENAPCEQVCPVAATVHSDEGLNDMAYNRCIGTRYCGNNCPYKVRRFNFFEYRWEQPAPNRDLSHLVLNPEVTVRHRGVMEKCTYCVQRIQKAKITARNEQRPLGPNEIVTACQQACPSQAIVFGDLSNPQSDVAKAHADPRAYAMLAELNVKPRTKYLARIRNPHPSLTAESESSHDSHGPQDATETPRHAAATRPRLGQKGGGQLMATALTANIDTTLEDPTKRAPLVIGDHDYRSVTDTVVGISDRRTPRAWYIAFAICSTGTLSFFAMIGYLVWRGTGIWGNNSPAFWAWPIVNFVFWVGIGHAGTLISAILFLFRQNWRTSINRFAEAMTIFAVCCAGIFPGIHVGRIWFAYWLAPYPASRLEMWPNFRSPLLWDVFAVGTYATVSLLFWYVGMIPDLATFRDRTKSRANKRSMAFSPSDGRAARDTGTVTKRRTCCLPLWQRLWC